VRLSRSPSLFGALLFQAAVEWTERVSKARPEVVSKAALLDRRVHLFDECQMLRGIGSDTAAKGRCEELSEAVNELLALHEQRALAAAAAAAPAVSEASWFEGDPMPAQLAAWGCSEELWDRVKDKRALVRLAAVASEARGRRRIERLKLTVIPRDEAAARAAARAARRAARVAPTSAERRAARRAARRASEASVQPAQPKTASARQATEGSDDNEGELGAVSRAARRAARRRASVPVPAAMPVPVPGEERARGEEGIAAAVDVAAAGVPAAAGAAASGASRRIDAPGKGGTAELPLADRSGIAAPSKVRAEDGAQRARGAQEVRPDDWTCESCGAHVFASKKSCYRCGAPRRRAGVTHSEEYRNAIPPLLREWGVDEALWSQVQDKTRLRKLAKDGDELNGRKRVASLRVKLGLE
jgi:hypothetical protein